MHREFVGVGPVRERGGSRSEAVGGGFGLLKL